MNIKSVHNSLLDKNPTAEQEANLEAFDQWTLSLCQNVSDSQLIHQIHVEQRGILQVKAQKVMTSL